MRYLQSKLIVLGLSDSTFTSAIKKAATDQKSAQALIDKLAADPKGVLKFDGAEALAKRMAQSAQADAKILRNAAALLKDAAGKIKQARFDGPLGNRVSDQWQIAKANYLHSYSSAAPVEPATVLTIILIVGFYALLATAAVLKLITAKDQIAECQNAAHARYNTCSSDAKKQPFPFNLGAEAGCLAELTLELAICVEEGFLPSIF